MERNFVLAIGIAAAAHALLLGIPRGAVPVRNEKPPAVLGGFEAVEVVELTTAAADAGESGAESPARPTEVVRHLEEPPVDPATKGFLLPIDTSPTNGLINREAAIVPAVRFGPGGEGGGVGGKPVVGVRFLDRTPTAKVRIAPDYPAAARHDGRDGSVTVEFIVDESGHVLDPRVVDSTDRVFEEPALRAIAKWRFEPGTINNRAVRFRMALPIVFRLASD